MSGIVTIRQIFLVLNIVFLGWCSAIGGIKTFDEIFKLEETIQLQKQENEPPGINAFKIGRDGKIWRVTTGRPDKTEVKIYSSKGEVLNVIRKKDIDPIKGYPYILFTDIAFDQHYRVYLLENVSGNVAMFDSTGRFLGYFGSLHHYDRGYPNCMGGFSIKIDNEGNVYFGGRCYEEVDKCPESRDFCIHKYDSEGRHIKSFFPFEKKLLELTPDLIVGDYMTHFDIDQEGNIWCVYGMVYQVFKYSPEGKLLQKFPGRSLFYKLPPEFKGKNFEAEKQAWWRSWTEIYELLLHKSDLVLLTFHTNSPSNWVLEIYDHNGNIVAPDVLTDYALLGKDDAGFLYFLLYDPKEKQESQEYIRIGKFSLKLKE